MLAERFCSGEIYMSFTWKCDTSILVSHHMINISEFLFACLFVVFFFFYITFQNVIQSNEGASLASSTKKTAQIFWLTDIIVSLLKSVECEGKKSAILL